MEVASVTIPELPSPFPSAINPHAHRMHQQSISWAVDHDMLDSDKLDRLHQARIGLLAALTNPLLDADMAQLSCDFNVWLFAVDDGYCDESPSGAKPVAMTKMAAGLNRILTCPDRSVPDAGRSSSALRDLCHRISAVTSPAQAARWKSATRDYLFGIVWEAANRSCGNGPTLEEYVDLRPAAGGITACFSLLDAFEYYEIPSSSWHSLAMEKLSRAAANVIAWDNDLTSYDRELSDHGAMHNLVSVLARHHGITPQQAVAVAVTMREQQLRVLQQMEEEICPTSSPEVHRYITALHYWISGYLRFAGISSRYTSPGKPERIK